MISFFRRRPSTPAIRTLDNIMNDVATLHIELLNHSDDLNEQGHAHAATASVFAAKSVEAHKQADKAEDAANHLGKLIG